MKHKEIEKEWILASASPRRKEILEELGLQFTVCPAQGEEKIDTTDPEKIVAALALQKAREVAEGTERPALVIGSDTVVALDGRILGKPGSREEAAEMLGALSGREHTVFTGVAVLAPGVRRVFHCATQVEFYPLNGEEIAWYVSTGEPMDKAGAYGIQGQGSLLVKGIRGDYFNVMGFPVAEVWRHLVALGILPPKNS